MLHQSDDYEVAGLFTTINAEFERVAMHAVRVELLRQQAQAVGLPLYLIEIPNPCSNEQYAAVMTDFMARASSKGVRYMAFGDLYLQDVRSNCEERMRGRPTRALLDEMIAGGLRACLTCVDPLDIEMGEVVTRDGFVFADCRLLVAATSAEQLKETACRQSHVLRFKSSV